MATRGALPHRPCAVATSRRTSGRTGNGAAPPLADAAGCATSAMQPAVPAGPHAYADSRSRSSGRLGPAGVVDAERLVGDEQEHAVGVLGGAVLHDATLGKPHEAAGPVLAPVGAQRAFEHVHAVRAGVGVPDVGEAGP